ncbi:MAG: DUF6597 domain-containing transcriptional factor [Hydrogenovibrio sp.]
MYQEQLPPLALSQVVDCFWQAEMHTQAQLIVPDGCQDWVFERTEHTTDAFLIGSMTEAQSVRVIGSKTFFGVRFRPGALSLLTAMPMQPLTNQRCDLNELFPFSNSLKAQLSTPELDLPAFAERLSTALLNSTSRLTSDNHRRLTYFAQAAEGNIQQLADHLHISRRHFHRLFTRAFGYSPRFYGKVQRFNRLNERLQQGDALLEATLEAGYYDQAHMNRDVKQLTGLTPRDWLNQT